MSKYLFEADYSADFLRWIKKIDHIDFNKISIKQLDCLQQEIIDLNDSALAYFFALDFDYKNFLMQKIILENKDYKYSLAFAKNIKNCDIKALQNIVVNSKKHKYICQFACFVKGANIKLLSDLIFKSNNPTYIYMMFKNIKGINLNKCKKIIIKSNKPKYLYELSKRLTNKKEIKLIEELIIKSGSFTYMRLFAENNKFANIDKIENVILETNNINEIKKFAKYVKKAKLANFLISL